MAQTVGQMSGVNGTIEVSDDNAVWVDISGSANKVDAGDQSRMTGEDYTFDGDTGLITSGKREPMDIKVSAVYTEAAAEAFEIVRAWHEVDGGQVVYIRWSPAGGATGDFMYTSTAGRISNFMYPSQEAGEGGPIVSEFTFKVPSVVKSVVV